VYDSFVHKSIFLKYRDRFISQQVYVHRSGRTARANQTGTAVSLVAPEDALHHRAICQYLGFKALPLLQVDLYSLPMLRQRVALAKQVRSLYICDCLECAFPDGFLDALFVTTSYLYDVPPPVSMPLSSYIVVLPCLRCFADLRAELRGQPEE
jgi:hypothetical protein